MLVGTVPRLASTRRLLRARFVHLLPPVPMLAVGCTARRSPLPDDRRPTLDRTDAKLAAAVSVAGASRSFREPSRAGDAHHPPRAPSRCCRRTRRAACRTSRSSPAGYRTTCASRRRSSSWSSATAQSFRKNGARELWLITDRCRRVTYQRKWAIDRAAAIPRPLDRGDPLLKSSTSTNYCGGCRAKISARPCEQLRIDLPRVCPGVSRNPGI